MSVSNKKAKDRIINALGDLYRVERHTTGMSSTHESAVKDAISALEAEYLAILTASGPVSYLKVTNEFKSAKSELDTIVAERTAIANSFVTAAKILGSITQVLKLF
jgi:hydrogenase maturation factor